MRVLLIAPLIPYDGIPHAGGQYLGTYAMALRQQGVDIEIVAPEPIGGDCGSAGLAMAPSRTIPRDGAQHLIARSWAAGRHVWQAVDPGIGVVRGFHQDPSFRKLVRSADLIHVQWTEMLPIVRLIRSIAPCTPIFCTEYDVFTQSVRRALRSPSPVQRAKALVRYKHVAGREAGLLNSVDRVYVFNRENVELLKSIGVTTPVAVTDLFVPVVKESPDLRNRRVIFAGAFHRPENSEAARWLIEKVWPRVREQVPDSELYLVGNGPPQWVKSSTTENIRVTGRVPLLAPYYLDAGVACAPLQRGAGVKIKVLEGMAHGIPVVTTSVGAEGIAGSAHDPAPLVVADTPAQFATALIRLLKDQRTRVSLGVAGRRWVRQRYDTRRSIEAIVRDMKEACGVPCDTSSVKQSDGTGD